MRVTRRRRIIAGLAVVAGAFGANAVIGGDAGAAAPPISPACQQLNAADQDAQARFAATAPHSNALKAGHDAAMAKRRAAFGCGLPV